MGEHSWSHLEVSRVEGRSVVLSARSAAPVRLLNPLNHGHAAWVFQSSYGGGFVAHDQVKLEVAVGADASLFLSSQASSKVYRQAEGRFALAARVADRGLMVLWPDPVVCFAGSAFDQSLRCELAGSAGLVLVDVVTSGRMARGERWKFERYRARLEVEIDGVLEVGEAALLAQAQGSLEGRLGETDALATVVVAGAGTQALADTVENAVNSASLAQPVRLVASRRGRTLVVRGSSTDSMALTTRLRELLGPSVAAMLGDDPLRRKW
jgi:urease accessory protein